MAFYPRKKKSLLIGINYLNTPHKLRGCHQDIDAMAEFLSYRGYANDHASRVILSDISGVPYNSPYFPTGRNIMNAMAWLVSEPNCTLFMHYSGHGGQVEDDEGYGRGIDGGDVEDTIVPIDFERNGQIPSAVLHERLVTSMAPGCTLFIVMDCCHSGSVMELPYVYRTDSDGRIAVMNNLKQGAMLFGEAEDMMHGGFNIGEARQLFAGATSFWRGLKHMGEQQEEELQADEFAGRYGSEVKYVTMLSGCRDDQTSADAKIQGRSTGAMTWAFLETMKRYPSPSYIQTLQLTRQFLDDSHYSQVPQLSCGVQMDLHQTPLIL